MITFSLVIPVYNSDFFLRNCLDSILEQTYSNFEVIAINDGSTDTSPQILNEYSKRDSRIKVIHSKNNGVVRAREIGVKLAIGEYIIFIDSDDSINKNLLFEINVLIKKKPGVEIVRFKCELINDKEGMDHDIYNINDFERFEIIDGLEALKKWTIKGKRYDVFWLYAIKKENLSLMKYCPNIRTNEDFAVIPLIIANANSVLMLDYIGYNYTCNNENSLTHRSFLEAQRKHALDFLRAYSFLMENINLIGNASGEDMNYFYNHYKKRLKRRYELLDESLKFELQEKFEALANKW